MQVRTKSPIYARLNYNDGDVTIGLTDPWYGRVKRCVKSLEKLENLPLSLRSSRIANNILGGVGLMTDEISLTVSGFALSFQICDIVRWAVEGLVTLGKDAVIRPPPAGATASAGGVPR